MLRVIGCIAQQHDLRLVGLAACICALACATTVHLLAGARAHSRRLSLIHLVASSVVFGCGVWSLHFVAMLAFITGVQIAYDVTLTFASILVAVLGSLLAFAVWLFAPSRSVRVLLGGFLLGLSVAAMHFCGVMAMQASATIHFENSEVLFSIAASLIFAIIALARCETLSSHRRRLEVATLLAFGICGLHFIAMAGLSLEPDFTGHYETAVLGSTGVAIAVGSFSLAILIVSLAATLMEQHLSQRAAMEHKRMQMLSDVSQEVVIICRDDTILQINAAGTRLFGASASQLVGSRVLDLVLDADKPAFLRHTLQDEANLAHEEIHLKTNGTTVAAELSCRTIDYEGKLALVIALRDLTDRNRDEAKIRHLAHHDALTDLPNRFLLRERFSHALASVKRADSCLALLCLDLDRFKPVNDLLGHAAGDALLIEVAKRLQAELRSSDTVARVGGDEFVIVAAFDQPENVALLAGRIIEALAQPFPLKAGTVEIGTTIGIALYPPDGSTQEELIHAADVALYRAKQEKRGTFRFFEAVMDEQLQARQKLERDLRHAIERGQLILHYQPLANCVTGEIEGFEALLRWHHPERGTISPLEFIPLAEETGLIVDIGKWVLETACAAAVQWDPPVWVAVNISPIQFRDGDLVKMISGILASTGLIPGRLEIEVTEGILMAQPKHAAEVLSALRDLGVRIAMDDFGTGYSSLSYLHEFKFDKIKIDRSFIARLGEAEDATIIIRTIIGLAHNLGLSIVAEGVETHVQMLALRELMCDQIQGYLIGRPMQMDVFTEFVSARAKIQIIGSASAGTQDGLEEYRTNA